MKLNLLNSNHSKINYLFDLFTCCLSFYRQISAARPLEIDFEVKGCEGENNVVHFLEHVQLYVTIRYTRRGALKINITSPHGKFFFSNLIIYGNMSVF